MYSSRKMNFSVYQKILDQSPQMSWQQGCKSVKERDLYLLEHELWTDCIFLVGQGVNAKEMKAHRLYLAKTSCVFQEMLYGENKITTFPILVPDVEPSVFKSMLEYIYCGEINLVSQDFAERLSAASNKYELHQLTELCRKFLYTPTTKITARAP